MKDCKYPSCSECEKPDCTMENSDIRAMLKRRGYQADLKRSREKQNEYRKRRRDSLPHCDSCENCVVVMGRNGQHLQRLCINDMRLVEYKVANCPIWCKKRKNADVKMSKTS